MSGRRYKGKVSRESAFFRFKDVSLDTVSLDIPGVDRLTADCTYPLPTRAPAARSSRLCVRVAVLRRRRSKPRLVRERSESPSLLPPERPTLGGLAIQPTCGRIAIAQSTFQADRGETRGVRRCAGCEEISQNSQQLREAACGEAPGCGWRKRFRRPRGTYAQAHCASYVRVRSLCKLAPAVELRSGATRKNLGPRFLQ